MSGGLRRYAERLWIYQRYVHGTLIGGLVVALLVLVPVHAAAAVFLAPTLMLHLSSGPGFGLVTGATGLILIFLVVFLVAAFAGDLSGGGAQLFLSQPISRTMYVATWLLASVATPTLVYVLSLVLPLLAIDPRLLSAVGLTDAMLAVAEVLEMGSLLFLVAVITRSKAAVVVLGLFLEFLLPWILLIPLVTIATVARGQPPWLKTFLTVYTMVYPSKLPLFSGSPQGPPLTPMQAASAAAALAALYWAASLLYARARMEVR